MANQRIDIDVGLKVDKTGLNQIKSSLQEIKNLTAQDLMKIGGHNDIKQAQGELDSLKRSIAAIDGALDKAFNTDLGTLNVSKFNQALKGMDLSQVYKDFSAAGAAGQTAFRNVTSQILTTNMQLKQTHSFLNEMATTMANTVKWGVASSLMNNFTGSIQKAYGYVKSLDTSLNDIRIVTGASADEMERFAVKANNAAKELGKSTTDYTKASLIYYQQGLSEKDVAARAETTLKAANVTGQSGEAVSEQLTAVWNGYKVSAEEAELYIDKLAAVAATTAADLEELSTGMSKVASAADLMGVDIDQLNAQMATIVSVTRQAPESVGTALKTIYARMGDIEAGLDTETTLGHYTEEMKAMGVNVLDANGKLRDMGAVLEEVGGKWQEMSREQQIALSQTMAGTRQYNNLLSLFDNWDMYTEALNTSANAAGTLQQQQDTYMESTQAHLNQLRAASEDLYDSLLDTDTINGVADGLTFVVKRFTDLVDGIGGGNNTLLMLGSTATRVFSQQIAQGLSTTIKNLQNVKYNTQQVSAQFEILRQFKDLSIGDKALTDIIGWKEQIMQLGSVVTAEENNQANAIIKARVELENEVRAWEKKKQVAEEYLQKTNVYNGAITGATKESTETKNIESALKTRIADYEKDQQAAKKYQTTISELVGATEKLNSVTEKHGEVSAEARAAELEELDVLIKLDDEMAELSAKAQLRKNYLALLDQESQEYKELTAAIDEYKNAQDEDKGAAAQKLLNAYQNATEKLKQLAKDAGNTVKQETNEVTKNFEKKVTEAELTWTQFINQLNSTKKIQSIVNIVGAVGQLVSVINTLSNINDIINDESLTGAEKTLKIISALTMAIPMLFMALKTLNTDIGTLLVLTKLTTDAQLQEVGVSGALKAAWMAEDGVLKGLIAKLGIYTLALAAIAGTVYLIVKAYNKEKDALEDATAAVQYQTEALEKLKAAQEEVNKSLEAYETATEKIKTLTEGTQEWRDAINEANSATLELLDKYPELANEIQNVNGKLEISEKGLELVSELSQNNVNQAQSDLYLAKANQLSKENDYNVVSTGRDINYHVGNQDFTASADVINEVVDKINNSGNDFLQDYTTIQKELGLQNVELAIALEANKEDLQKLAQEVAANTAAMQLYYNQAASGYLQKDEAYQNASAGEQAIISEIAGGKLQEETQRLYNEKYKDQVGGMWDEDIQKLYAESIGAEATKNKGDNLGEYLIDGEWKTISDETARMALAAEEAAGGLEGLSEGVVEASNSLSEMNLGEDIHNAALGFANGNTADLSGLSVDQLGQLGNINNFTDEIAQQLGYEGENPAQQYMKAIDDAISQELENRASRLQEEIQNAPDTIAENLNGVMNVTELDTFNKAGGIDIGAVDQESWDKMISEGLSLEDVFNEIDWSSIDPSKPTEWFKNAFEQAINEADYSKDNEQDVEANYSADAEKYEIDEEAYRNTTELIQEMAEESEDLHEALKNQEDTAQEVAKDLLRYDKAVESVKENSKDWLKILKSGNLQDIGESMEDITNAYGNMLDIDGSMLSEDFLTSTKNMEDLQAAANGSEEAYNRLAEAARQDMAAKIGFDDAEFQSKFNSLMEQVGNPPLDELKVGADLDNGNFLSKLSEMVNQAGMTAEEATNYLSSMGIDAEVETDTTTTPETSTVIKGYRPKLSWGSHNVNLGPLGDFDMKVPQLEFDTITETVKTDKQIAANALRVTSAKKSSGGGFKHKNSSHGSGSKGGGKKSGGGGGGSTPKKTTTKKQEKTADRYHDINNQIDKLATKFDRLAEAQDRLHGKDLYNNLNKQLKVINQQIKASKEKLKIAKEEKKELQDKLKKEGFKFDIDGDISNYKTRLEQLRKTINDKVSKYNKMSAKNQNKKAGKKLAEQIEKLKEEYAEIEDWIKQYDDLLVNTIPELEDEVTQLARTKVEIQVEKLKIKADLTLDISEALRQWEDFKREIFQSDNPLDEITSDMTTMDSIMASNSIRENAKGLNNATQALDDIQNGRWTKYSDAYILKDENGNPIRDENGNYKFDEQAARDTIDYFQDAIQGEMETFYDAVRGAYDAYLTSVENAIEATHDYHDALNDVQDVLDHTMNMITMLKGEDAFEDIESILNQKINATKAEIKAIKAAIDESQKYTTETVVNADGVSEVVNVSRTQYLEKMQAQYEEEIASLENQIATEKDDTKKAELEVELNNLKIIAETNQKELDMEREYMQELQANLRENVEEYTELLIQRYQNAVSKALKGFNTYLTGALGTEGMSREWENAIAQEDRYLDKINAAYELRSLENKINESINDTDSLSAQKRLNEFKEKELKLLREKDKLTKYDVDRANKLYEIELKKIALEEARNNKSQMRLRRDSSGNYSYQFVADDESVSKAQQELDASMNDLYNMEKEEYRNKTEELNQVREDFNDFNQWWSEQSEEYRKNNQAWYDEQVKSYEEQMKDISDLALTARNQTLATANDLMGEDFNETVMEEMLPTWKTAMATMVDQVQNETGFQAAMTNAINIISEASAELTSSLNTLNKIIGGTKEGSLADTTNKYYTDATQGANDYAKAQQAVVEQTKAEKEAVAELREELDALLVTRGKFGNVGGGAQDGSGGTNDNGYNKELGLGWGAIGDSTEEEIENDVEDAQGINSGVPNNRQVATLTDGRKVGIAAAYLYRKNSGGWSQKKMVEIFGDAQKKTLWTFIQNAKSKDAKAKAAQNDKNPKTKPVWSKAHKFYNNSKNNKALAYTYSKAKDWKKSKKVEFRTGGYTGNWSSDEGKLAVLHKKELVLNAKDTENLLSIINIVRDLTKNAMSGKPTKEQKEMSIKSEALFESLAEIRKELLTMNETDQFLAEKELFKEESMLSLLDNLAVLEEGFKEFTGTEFLEALDYLNVFKDTLNTQLNNQNYQNELALSSTEYQAKLFEELNQTLTATILDSVQSHLEKLNTNISHQAQVLTQIADDNKKSFANDKTDIQQEVKVYADFPNATSANEIQKALENLVNAATQHAYTTRR